jgi:hypothetical protein
VIPFCTSIDLELRLSNSDPTSLLYDRNRLRLRQLPCFVAPCSLRQIVLKLGTVPKVNPAFLCALDSMVRATHRKGLLFLQHVLARLHFGVESMQPRCLFRNPKFRAFTAKKRRPLSAVAANRCCLATVRSGNFPAVSRRELVFGRCNDERVPRSSRRSLPDNTTSNQQTKYQPA